MLRPRPPPPNPCIRLPRVSPSLRKQAALSAAVCVVPVDPLVPDWFPVKRRGCPRRWQGPVRNGGGWAAALGNLGRLTGNQFREPAGSTETTQTAGRTRRPCLATKLEKPWVNLIARIGRRRAAAAFPPIGAPEAQNTPRFKTRRPCPRQRSTPADGSAGRQAPPRPPRIANP